MDYVLVTGAEAVLLPYMGWGLRRQGERDWFQGVATAGENYDPHIGLVIGLLNFRPRWHQSRFGPKTH